MEIGILGAEINNPNLGCQALCWALLQMLEEISKTHDIEMKYNIFEGKPDNTKKAHLCSKLGIESISIESIKLGIQSDLFRKVKHYSDVLTCREIIKKCDILIVLTLGDSFSDLYGTRILYTTGLYILYAKKQGVSVLMGPQTYGPFSEKKNIKFARKVLNACDYIIARDSMSSAFVERLIAKKVSVTDDIAFSLKKDEKIIQSDKIKIGINIAGLLAEAVWHVRCDRC